VWGPEKRPGPGSFGNERRLSYHSLTQTKNDYLVISRLPRSAALFVFAEAVCGGEAILIRVNAGHCRSHSLRQPSVPKEQVIGQRSQKRENDHRPAVQARDVAGPQGAQSNARRSEKVLSQ